VSSRHKNLVILQKMLVMNNLPYLDARETVNFVWDKPETIGKVQLRVTDAFGRTIGIWNFEANALTVSVANLPDGMYFYQVLCENCPTEVGKLVIKH
jgi:hypothetical protein